MLGALGATMLGAVACGSKSGQDAPTGSSGAGGAGGTNLGGSSNSGGTSGMAGIPTAEGVTEHVFDPQATDPALEPASEYGSHVAYLSETAPRDSLFVFLAASEGEPTQYKYIENAGAALGYYVLGLAYPNNDVVDLRCKQTSDESCQDLVHAETLTGEDVSSLVDVDPENSIENRIEKALSYLATTFPSEGWDKFVTDSGEVRWNAIRLGGHSQGGGHAAYAATQHEVERVCTFASPADWNDSANDGAGGPSPWLSAPSATPAEAYYGFGHGQDSIVPWDHLKAIWAALGLPGSPVNVDNERPNYGDSHQLYTLFAGDSGVGAVNHSRVVGDFATSLDDDGAPIYLPVWQYVCFD